MANCGILLNDGTSFLLLNTGDFYLLNDNTCATEPGAEVADTGPPPGGAGLHRESYLAWWEREWNRIRAERKKKKKKKVPPKKRELIEELDEATLELRAQVQEREATEAYTQELQRAVLDAALLLNDAYEAKVSQERLRREIAILQEHIRELDDEETILLALH